MKVPAYLFLVQSGQIRLIYDKIILRIFLTKFDKTAILKTEKSRHPKNILAFSLELQLYNGLSTKSFMFVQKFLKLATILHWHYPNMYISVFLSANFIYQKCQLYLVYWVMIYYILFTQTTDLRWHFYTPKFIVSYYAVFWGTRILCQNILLNRCWQICL